MSPLQQEDLAFCREHVSAHDPWFRLHLAFAARQQADSILAAQALFAMLERTLELSEESLVIAQLAWWREELQPEKAPGSAHPVLRALHARQQAPLFSSAMADSLIAPMFHRLHAEPLADENALKTLCDEVAGPRIRAQLGALDSEFDPAWLDGQFAGSGLACLIDAAVRTRQRSWWFVPLSMQARLQAGPDTSIQAGDKVAEIYETLMRLSEAWSVDEYRALKKLQEYSPAATLAARHVTAQIKVRSIRLSRTLKKMAAGKGIHPGRWGAGDLFRIWVACRKVA